MKQFFYVFLLLTFMACEKDNQVQEPALQSITVTPVKQGNTEVLTDVSFGSSKVGFICGAMGTFLKTTDGGETWTSIKSGIQPSLNCIQAIDDKNVYMARNELYHSVDGGTSWETAGLENIGSGINEICFVDSKTGFLTKNGVMKTTDSGKTWNLKFDSGNDNEYYALNYNKLQFLDKNNGFCAGGKTYDGNSVGNMVKTTDGGETWTSLKLQMSQVTAFGFLDKNVGFIFNFNQELWKTTDGGATWTKVSSTVPEKYPDCYVINASKIVLRTAKQIYHSLDGGVTWIKDFELSAAETQLTRMRFINSRTGYVVGSNGYIAKLTLN